jgi:arginyl-tRNA synthetase
VKDVANSYATGAKRYETEEVFQKFVLDVNKKIYEKQDEEVNKAYDEGRKITLEYFDVLYKKFGTHFDFYFFESTTGEFGKALVHENKDVFAESEGAIVYHGEARDPKLHTRVFINKEGLPTYEAKELGLAKIKYDTYPYDVSVVITGNEINDYFKVLLSAMGEIFPELAKRTKHISHGMLRLPTGKMSSRTGDVITAEWLIDEAKKKVQEKLDASDRDIADKELLAEQVAIAALKYSILKQAPGKDIIFDLEKSISFDGDSGPYLQYSYARSLSLLEKFKQEIGALPNEAEAGALESDKSEVSQLLYRFPEIVEKSLVEYSPHFTTLYLIELASAFNSFYAHNQIVNPSDMAKSKERILLTQAVSFVLKNGLTLLGIATPEKM